MSIYLEEGYPILNDIMRLMDEGTRVVLCIKDKNQYVHSYNRYIFKNGKLERFSGGQPGDKTIQDLV